MYVSEWPVTDVREKQGSKEIFNMIYCSEWAVLKCAFHRNPSFVEAQKVTFQFFSFFSAQHSDKCEHAHFLLQERFNSIKSESIMFKCCIFHALSQSNAWCMRDACYLRELKKEHRKIARHWKGDGEKQTNNIAIKSQNLVRKLSIDGKSHESKNL